MAEQSQAPPPTSSEPTDVDIPRVLRIASALVTIVIGCAVLSFGLRAWFARESSAPASAYSDPRTVQAFATPRLETAPARDIAAFKRDKAQKLDGYAWIDRRRGIVQIPIERAMELMVQRGQGSAHAENR